MAEKCENFESCLFFKSFGDGEDEMKEVWRSLFCENKEMTKKCARIVYVQENKEPPPDTMAPSGTII